VNEPKVASATSRYGMRKAAVLNALWIPLSVQDTALMAIAIPAVLLRLDPDNHVRALALLASAVAGVSMVIPPLAGALSDWMRRSGTPRRAFVVGGALADVVALVLLSGASTEGSVVTLMLIATAAYNVALAAYSAMLPDLVPRAVWGAVSGVRGVAMLAGTLLGFLIAGVTSPATTFLLTGIAIALGLLTLLPVREPRELAAVDHASVRDWHDFILVFIARGLIVFGLALLYTFIYYFFHDILKMTNAPAGTAFVGACGVLGAVASSVFLGVLSDRFSRKYIVALSGLPMTAAALGFALVPREDTILGFAVLFGLGYGGINAVGWALAIDAMPALGDVARDLGIWGIAQNLPFVVAPAVGYWILAQFGGGLDAFRALFVASAISFAAGSLATLWIRGPRTRTRTQPASS
jgi:MFS family permease